MDATADLFHLEKSAGRESRRMDSRKQGLPHGSRYRYAPGQSLCTLPLNLSGPQQGDFACRFEQTSFYKAS